MAFPVLNVGGRIELSVMGTFDTSNEIANVYWFQNVGSPVTTEATLLEDMEDLIVALYNVLQALYWTGVVWDRFRVRYFQEGFTSGVVTMTAPVAGTRSDGTEAPGVAALVYFPLGLARRQLRKYIGPLGLGRVDPADGQLSGFTLGALGTFSDLLLAPMAASNSTYRYGIPVPDSSDFIVPTTAAISVQAAYQRRRKPGVGA